VTISVHDISVATYLQTLGAVIGFLEKASAHCQEKGLDLGELLEARIHPDMHPLSYQLRAIVHHSLGAVRGVQAGVFQPPQPGSEMDYAALQKHVTEARDVLQALDRGEVEALAGRDVRFEFGEYKLPFTAENFILSFSLPNFFFHATTAYDILRMKGVPVGKLDFMGRLRLKH